MIGELIVNSATWTQAFIIQHLVSMTFELAGESNAVEFVSAYASTCPSSIREEKCMFWTELDSTGICRRRAPDRFDGP